MPRPRRHTGLRRNPLSLTGFVAMLAFIIGMGRMWGVPPLTSEPLFETWRMEDGLPQNHATAITQTRDGYLWLGSYNGVARFDGVRFTVFDSINTPGLASSRVSSLFEDAAGTLWLGHEGGELTRYSNGGFATVPTPTHWPREPITGIREDASHDLWVLGRRGQVMRVSDGQTVSPTLELPSGPLPVLVHDSAGTLWRLHEGKLSAVTLDTQRSPSRVPPADEFFEHATKSRQGGIRLASNQRVRLWREGKPETFWGNPPWGKSSVTALLESRSGDLWAGTLDQGLFRLAPDGSFSQFTHTNGFPHAWVRCLFEDREGTLWAGTGGGGLSAVRERSVLMVKAPDDWQRRTLLSVSAAADDSLWIGTEGGGVYHWKGVSFAHFEKDSGLGNFFVWSVLEGADGGVWAGTWGSGAYRLSSSKFSPSLSPLNDSIRALALHNTRDGALWVGTQRGLVRVKDGRSTQLANSLEQPDVRCIAEADDGTIWFGMAGGGLGRWRGGIATQFRKADGLPSDYVWSLLPEKDGTLWIGTFGGGLCRLRGERFATIGLNEGLPSNIICHIAEDNQGLLWMSSYAGILRASKSGLNHCADGQVNSIPVHAYGKADGLASMECSGGSQPSGCRTSDGRLWFPTSRGLAVVSPANLRTNLLAPPVVIEALFVNGSSGAGYRTETGAPPSQLRNDRMTLTQYYRIPPGRHRLEFRYTALSFVASQQLRFKYRLDGLDDEWVDAGTDRNANYSFLAPGSYTFRVIAANNDGVWNEEGAALALTVLPHFWQTWQFQTGILLAASLAVGGTARSVTRRRYRRKLERLERQRAIERERTRIAKDIHDDLGASLTRITLLSQSARNRGGGDPGGATKDLDQIYLTARDLTKAMDEIVWAVNPHHDTLDSLVTYLGRFAQDFAGAAGIRCRLDVPIELPGWPLSAEVRHNLFLAVKEALNNALKHARAHEINLSLRLEVSGFSLTVQDNGCGFDINRALQGASEQAAGERVRASSGNGLSNMLKRLEEIRGRCVVESSPDTGTKVTLTVPMT